MVWLFKSRKVNPQSQITETQKIDALAKRLKMYAENADIDHGYTEEHLSEILLSISTEQQYIKELAYIALFKLAQSNNTIVSSAAFSKIPRLMYLSKSGTISCLKHFKDLLMSENPYVRTSTQNLLEELTSFEGYEFEPEINEYLKNLALYENLKTRQMVFDLLTHLVLNSAQTNSFEARLQIICDFAKPKTSSSELKVIALNSLVRLAKSSNLFTRSYVFKKLEHLYQYFQDSSDRDRFNNKLLELFQRKDTRKATYNLLQKLLLSQSLNTQHIADTFAAISRTDDPDAFKLLHNLLVDLSTSDSKEKIFICVNTLRIIIQEDSKSKKLEEIFLLAKLAVSEDTIKRDTARDALIHLVEIPGITFPIIEMVNRLIPFEPHELITLLKVSKTLADRKYFVDEILNNSNVGASDLLSAIDATSDSSELFEPLLSKFFTLHSENADPDLGYINSILEFGGNRTTLFIGKMKVAQLAILGSQKAQLLVRNFSQEDASRICNFLTGSNHSERSIGPLLNSLYGIVKRDESSTSIALQMLNKICNGQLDFLTFSTTPFSLY